MSDRRDLARLVAALRQELEWASRVGVEVAAAPPPAVAAPEPVDSGLVPEWAGRPVPPQEEAAVAEEEELPPAFEPDPPELEPEPAPPAPPRADRPGLRPWERYLDDPQPPSTGRTQNGAPPSPNRRPEMSADETEARLARSESLEQVRAILGDCIRCKLHTAGRKQIVFGVGNPKAELMFVGEAPGRQEDLQGEPFVGDAGQLLTKIIESGMKMPRSEVYIANIVKCRPPGNRDPEPDEVVACEKFLRAQIQQVKPKVLVALGKYAAQTLLRSKTPITRLRGTWQRYEGIDLMPTYHPAYLLRNPAEKRPVWEDMQEVMRRLGWSDRR